MSSDWGATGVTTLKPVQLGEDTQCQLTLALKTNGIKTVPQEFFSLLEQAISMFNSGDELAEASKPAKVRKNLQSVINRTNELNNMLNELDGNSLRLIGQINGGLPAIREHLIQILGIVEGAAQIANEYPLKGRLKQNNRLILAMDVADALKKHFFIQPTTTKDGLFESILAIVLERATGRSVTSIHDLARKAMKSRKKNSNGLTEYLLHEDD